MAQQTSGSVTKAAAKEPAARKVAAKNVVSKRVSTKKAAEKKAAAKKAAAKKASSKKDAEKKDAEKRVSAKEASPKKVSSKNAAAKKDAASVASKRPAARKSAAAKVAAKKTGARIVEAKKPVAKKIAAKKPEAKTVTARNVTSKQTTSAAPKLLSGGNPQIAKGHGDEPVQAYIAAMPDWKRAIGARIDALVERAVPGVRKAVKWNSPLYGMEPDRWFLGLHVFARYVKVAFFNGGSLDPKPPEASKHAHVRYLHIHEDGAFDEAQFVDWLRQASRLPGEKM
jgi:hypothetical protein